MGNNQGYKLNDEQMQEFFNDWALAFEQGTPKTDFCKIASQKFGVDLFTSDLNHYMDLFNPELKEKTLTKGKAKDPNAPKKPRAPKPTNIDGGLPKEVLQDATIMHQLGLVEQTPITNHNVVMDNEKIDNSGNIRIACTLDQCRILKNFAMLKKESIKNIVLDALEQYYAQDENIKAYKKAIELLTEIY